jgi:broad specificity phosphatase PhoE
MLVYLIRHGLTDYNADGRVQGWLDIPLNPEGREQARKIALRLSVKPVTQVYASTLSRAAETGRAIASTRGVPLTLDERLREYNMGDWAGKTGDEITAESAAFRALGEAPEIPGGETARQMRDRVESFLADLINTHASMPGRIAVVSHGGTLGAVLAAMLHLPVTRRQPFSFGNVSLTEALWSEGSWRLRTLNDQHHLRG